MGGDRGGKSGEDSGVVSLVQRRVAWQWLEVLGAACKMVTA